MNEAEAHLRAAPATSIVVLVPVLDRPHRVIPLLAALEAARGEAGYRTVFLASSSDGRERGALRYADADEIVVPWQPGRGDWAKKINYGYARTTEPFVLLAADDIRPHKGWAEALLACAAETGAGVIGTLDLGNSNVTAGDFSTHPLVRRSYIDAHGTIDQPGLVLHEGYDHNFPDRELAETAKAREQWAFCRDAIVEHLHPHWGKGQPDSTYRKGLANFNADKALFNRRRALWSGRALVKRPRYFAR